MLERNQLLNFLQTELQVDRINDYCPNGLQVEGKKHINRIVTGVTASQALIDAAVRTKADAILVHHGYFWKGESAVITGMKKNRLQSLLQHDINLFAYHLPLDIHPLLGNNAQLGQLLSLQNITALSNVEPTGIVMQGEFAEEQSAVQVKQQLELLLQRSVLLHEGGNSKVNKVAWCTGGGQGYIEQAVACGAQMFITGEVSEQTIHVSRELGIHFIAAGHHATERYGIKALGEYIAKNFDVIVDFVDIDNPA